MIDKAAFKAAWRRLAVQFRQEIADESSPASAESAAMYFEYLSELMDTDEFLCAAHALWASGRWFPRPNDFLTIRAGAEWSLVLETAAAYRPPEAGWVEHWRKLTPRTQAAVKRLGGIDAVRAQMEFSVPKLRESFQAAYEEEATAEALTLPMPRVQLAIEGAR